MHNSRPDPELRDLCSRCGTRSVPGKMALKISETVERLFSAGKDLDMTGISFHKLAG